MPGLAHFCEHLLFMVCLRVHIVGEAESDILTHREQSNSRRRMTTQRCVLYFFLISSTNLPTVSGQK
jgi:hypothetical protein